MNKFSVCVLLLSTLLFVGCGGREDGNVLENATVDDVAEYERMVAEEAKKAEESYKNSPGN